MPHPTNPEMQEWAAKAVAVMLGRVKQSLVSYYLMRAKELK